MNTFHVLVVGAVVAESEFVANGWSSELLRYEIPG
jgi:hypothetical protein